MKRLARRLAWLMLAAALGVLVARLFLPPARMPLPPLTGEVERIVIEKAARRMSLIQNGKTVRSYRIALGFTPDGDKQRQGDGKTPEGEFTIDRRNDRSAFHLSLGLDYPRAEDRAEAARAAVDPGGDIFIHGQPNAVSEGFKLGGDWTAGCVALTNAEMREIWQVAPVGTKVEIRP